MSLLDENETIREKMCIKDLFILLNLQYNFLMHMHKSLIYYKRFCERLNLCHVEYFSISLIFSRNSTVFTYDFREKRKPINISPASVFDIDISLCQFVIYNYN